MVTNRPIPPCPLGAVLLFSSVAWIALAGCRSADPRTDLQDHLRSSIPEDGRRAELAEFVEQRDAAQDAYRAEHERFAENLGAANADYDTRPEDLDEILGEVDRAWESYRDRVISLSLEMRERTTEEEWRALAAIDVESILAGPAQGHLE